MYNLKIYIFTKNNLHIIYFYIMLNIYVNNNIKIK